MEHPKSETDYALFLKYTLSRDNLFYYEFGSGGFTESVCAQPNVMLMWSVESDASYYDFMKHTANIRHAIHARKLVYTLVDLQCNYAIDEHPGIEARRIDWARFYTHIHGVAYMPDIVFIDGPFRVACALHTHMAIDESRFVLFNDFLGHPAYTILLKYFRIIEVGQKMAVLQKRIGVPINAAELAVYETDPR